MKVKAVVVSMSNCSPLLMDDEIPGTATLGNGETVKAILSRKEGSIEWLNEKREPLNLIVKFFDYETYPSDRNSIGEAAATEASSSTA